MHGQNRTAGYGGAGMSESTGTSETTGTILVGPSQTVSSITLRPDRARSLFLLGHGAGAGMRHPFLESLAQRLASREVATLRYHFPYMERGGRRPDPPSLLLATVNAAAAVAREMAPDLRLFAGGKSMGGRITSMAAADGTLGDVRGLIFVGYPLHAPGKGGARAPASRREHLSHIAAPMLFLQGTRDELADIDEIRKVCVSLGDRALLGIFPDADHSFHVPKRSGRTDDEVLDDLAETIDLWTRTQGEDHPLRTDE
jgi:hypothetical protein